jgi:hypothetical protein
MAEAGADGGGLMGRYASGTTVPVEKSRAEIEATLIRYGANEFHTGWQEGKAMIGFRLKDLYVRFILPIPAKVEKRFTHKKDRHGYLVKNTELQAEAAWNQEVRQRWRALLLTIKAKLEAVECGISTIEQEFLAFIVLPNQITLGDWIIQHALPAIRDGAMPLMLEAPREEKE